MRTWVRTALAVTLLGAAPVAAVALTPSAAMAAPSCNAGTWGGIYGWGDCRGMGSSKWQLKVSCTWGASATSSVITGDGHVDVQCPWGSARTASIIFV
ncbi:hypothetical protein [Micromonospora inaquosa]|nr:hypothetical protein [Micromonospora inaquosa]